MTDNQPKETLLDCREAFEKWLTYDGNYPHLKYKHFGGNYIHEESCMKWDAWKAAWNNRHNPSPAPQPQDADRANGLTRPADMSEKPEMEKVSNSTPLKVALKWFELALVSPLYTHSEEVKKCIETILAALSTDQYEQGFTAGHKSRDQEIRELVDGLSDGMNAVLDMVIVALHINKDTKNKHKSLMNEWIEKAKTLIAKHTNNQGEK